jgi:hypothetical protein
MKVYINEGVESKRAKKAIGDRWVLCIAPIAAGMGKVHGENLVVTN